MLTAEARSRLAVVLVGARNPQNIGAAARAMQDFGFSDLRIVNSYAPPFEAARLEASSAVAADAIMQSAQLFSPLPEAIADRTYTVGTTAIGGRELSRRILPLPEARPALLAHLTGNTDGIGTESGSPVGNQQASTHKVALLFGSEKTGLTNEHLSYCSELLTIPMFAPAGRHLSMNLGQSVAVCLYELTRQGFEGVRELPVVTQAPPNTEDRERLLALVIETMRVSDYARRFPANARLETVRRLAAQLGLTRDEISTWMGLFRQLLRRLPEATQKDPSCDFLQP